MAKRVEIEEAPAESMADAPEEQAMPAAVQTASGIKGANPAPTEFQQAIIDEAARLLAASMSAEK